MTTTQRSGRRLPWQAQLAVDIALAPVTFLVLNGRFGISTFEAVVISVVIGLVWTAIGLVITRKLNALALIVVAGVVLGAALTAATGSVEFSVAKDSIFTLVLGLAMLGSLLLARPLMFHLVQPFATHDGDPAETAEWIKSWTSPMFRHSMRVMTTAWGLGFLLDAVLRQTFVWTAPIDVSEVLSPVLTAIVVFSLLGWSASYGRRTDAARAVAEAAQR